MLNCSTKKGNISISSLAREGALPSTRDTSSWADQKNTDGDYHHTVSQSHTNAQHPHTPFEFYSPQTARQGQINTCRLVWQTQRRERSRAWKQVAFLTYTVDDQLWTACCFLHVKFYTQYVVIYSTEEGVMCYWDILIMNLIKHDDCYVKVYFCRLVTKVQVELQSLKSRMWRE